MFPLISTVFIASLVGSAHCVGMCGPFALIAASSQGNNQTPRGFSQVSLPVVAYHFGRFLVYVAIGALFGLLGQTLNLGASLAGFQRVATFLAGAAMILVGLVAMSRQLGVRLPLPDAGKPMHRLSAFWFSKTKHMRPTRRAFLMGGMTAVMPCGWLYAFALAAGGTGSIFLGMITMAFFWLGSVPLLAALMLGVNQLFGRLQSRLPLIMSVALIVVGGLTVFYRVPVSLGNEPIELSNPTEVIKHVEEIDHEKLPCCEN